MAATSHTLVDIITEILRHAPWLGFAATADSIAAGSITDVSEFGNSGNGSGNFKDRWIYRYDQTTEDRKKRATTVTSAGVLSHGSPTVYADTGNTKVYMLLAMDPDELIGLIQNVTRRLRIKTLTALSGARISAGSGPPHDMDMEFATAVYWGATVALGGSTATNITPTKAATDLYSGTNGLKLTATGASGNVKGEKIRINPSHGFYSAAIARADVGTVGFTWYDTSGTAVFSQAAITHTGETFCLLERYDVAPTGCEEIQPMFTLSGASDIGIVDCVFGPYEVNQTMFNLPTWMDETFEVKALRLSKFLNGVGQGVYDGFSRKFLDNWVQPNYFELENFNRDVDSARVQLQQDYKLPQMPVWISTERTMIDVEPLTSETSTTTVPFDQVVAYSMVELLTDVSNRSPKPFYTQELAKWQGRVTVEELARPSLPRPTPRRHIALRA